MASREITKPSEAQTLNEESKEGVTPGDPLCDGQASTEASMEFDLGNYYNSLVYAFLHANDHKQWILKEF